MGRVKKCLLLWIISTTLLLLCYLGFVLGLRHYKPSIEKPSGIKVECLEEGNKITWDPVDFATTYRVFRRTPQHDWALLTVTSSSKRSYLDEDPSVYQEVYEYSVKAFVSSAFCEDALSGYSKAVRAQRDAAEAGVEG